MKKIKLLVTGCMGRMGQQIITSVKKDRNFKLVALTESKKTNRKINGIKVNLNTEALFKNADLIIDFTVPRCTFQVLKIASKLKKKVVIGTTGFNKKEENLIKNFSRKIPILKAGNMSLGINLFINFFIFCKSYKFKIFVFFYGRNYLLSHPTHTTGH